MRECEHVACVREEECGGAGERTGRWVDLLDMERYMDCADQTAGREMEIGEAVVCDLRWNWQIAQ